MNKFYTFLAAILLTTSTFAQAPEKMSYQAVIRNSSDALVANQAVGMKISILQGSASGTAVYVETQTPTTNINGLVSLEIGAGTPVTGTFAGIDWATGPYFIKTETDPTGSTTYTIAGTSQLMSVPYALYAKTVEQKTYVLNTFYAELGGYIIDINTDGTHGLVLALQDQGVSNWYEANDLVNNPNNHDVNGAKFRDWRLPTRRELYYIGGNDFFWSSTEFDATQAWGWDPLGGYPSEKNKTDNTIYVHAVRSF